MPLTASVVLCTWNGARFLPAQWASLLAQSRLPDEIVVRDDASTDATPAMLDRLAYAARARGVTVRCLRGGRNVGYVANFEAALREATGAVLFLCDQDDVWHPHKLATQLAEFARRPRLLLLCGDARRVDAGGHDLGRSLFAVLRMRSDELRRVHSGHGFDVLLRRSMATGATVALRRGLLLDALPFPPCWVHDEWLAIIAAARGGFDCEEFALVDYRQHARNEIGMPDRGLREQWRDLRRPRGVLLGGLIARAEVLAERLQQLADRVAPVAGDDLDGALAHWRVRRAIAGAPWRRVGTVGRELCSGRYRRFGTGWRSALRDLVRRD